jgi:hypothetical protein
MSKFTQTRPSSHSALRRRELLCMAPFAITAGLVPRGAALPRPSNHAGSISGLIALWDQEEPSTSAVKPTSAKRIDDIAAGCNVGLISAFRSDLTADENQQRSAELQQALGRFWCLDIEVRLTERGAPFVRRTWMEHAYLLLGGKSFDSGNLKGFLRQYGALHNQRLVLYKPFDARMAYLLGTRNSLVPLRKQIVCVGEFKAARMPNYFKYIREHESPIDVVSIRFPIRKSFFNRVGGEY